MSLTFVFETVNSGQLSTRQTILEWYCSGMSMRMWTGIELLKVLWWPTSTALERVSLIWEICPLVPHDSLIAFSHAKQVLLERLNCLSTLTSTAGSGPSLLLYVALCFLLYPFVFAWWWQLFVDLSIPYRWAVFQKQWCLTFSLTQWTGALSKQGKRLKKRQKNVHVIHILSQMVAN